MNLIEKWADRMMRRIAWKCTKIEGKKETKSKRCEYIDNLKVSFEKYKNQHKEEQKNPQNILPQEQIQQRENTER